MLTLVADTNVVFPAIIRPGRMRKLLFDERLQLYAPEELVEELETLQDKILKFTNLSPEEISFIKRVITTQIIRIVPRKTYLQTARNIYPLVATVDPKDTPFVALSIYLDALLWTGDKGLLKLSLETKKFRAIDTRGVEMLLEGKPWREVEEYLAKRYSEL